eukprot:c11314_g1_i1.p1 GENE.c11314_g1_i1~~c11314_g1_i1.p1  ORF type:complete len:524 (+),score=111.16 c11314_g1_i1:34-1572(+)
MKEFSWEEVRQHNKDTDCWIVIDNKVFDVTKFAKMHPGGKALLYDNGGKDATEAFFQFHRLDVLAKYEQRLLIGKIAGAKIPEHPGSAEISRVPFGEPSAEQGFKTPYYNESHLAFRRNLRQYLAKEIAVNAAAWEEAGTVPSAELFKKLGRAGLWACRLSPGPHLKLFDNVFGVKPEQFDSFHELITHDEVCRLGCPGLVDGLGSGLVIGLPAVVAFGPPEMKAKVVPECVLGDKRICLAISEPVAGSDVANIQATAVKSPCGQFYIVNGVKKWITNGTFCDYFVTAVRTGGEGLGGISLLLIERSEGVETEPIKTSYSPAAGTAYITFENVKVPVSNLLGKENQGFGCIMANFNHERWVICVGGTRANRVVVEECFKWANQRKVFGKSLVEQPVIRNKLAKMVANVEACQNWLENITFQMKTMSYKDQSLYLAGPIALLKYQTTRVTSLVMDDAAQIFGGRAISRTGMGQVIERLARAQKFSAILGGSEEIMADLGIRQSLRAYPQGVKL